LVSNYYQLGHRWQVDTMSASVFLSSIDTATDFCGEHVI
jgi:hypothetical protein